MGTTEAMSERTTRGGVREIQRALVDAAALVAEPEYDSTSAEVRGRFGSLSSFVPTGRSMDCRCPGNGCEEIRFEEGAFDGLEEVLATTGTMDQVIGRSVLSPSPPEWPEWTP